MDASPSPSENDYYFSIVCPVCSTRMDVHGGQIGREVHCPDCTHAMLVRTPPMRERRQREQFDDAEDDSFGLSEAGIVPMLPVAPVSEIRRVTSIGEDAMRAAEAEWARSKAERPRRERGVPLEEHRDDEPLPTNRWLTARLGPALSDPAGVFRWLMLAAVLQIVAWSASAAMRYAEGSTFAEQFSGLLLTVFTVLAGGFGLAAAAANLLAVVRDTANGQDRVEDWPTFSVMDWLGDALYVIGSAFPAALVGSVAAQWMTAEWTFLSCLLVALFSFPVFLLSSLENGSPLMLVSKPIWRSVVLLRSAWWQLYGLSGLLAAGAVLGWQLRRLENTLLNYVAALCVVAASIVYARLVGRVAWLAQEALGDEESLEAVDAEPDGTG